MGPYFRGGTKVPSDVVASTCYVPKTARFLSYIKGKERTLRVGLAAWRREERDPVRFRRANKARLDFKDARVM